MASMLRDIASTDTQRNGIATVVSEFKNWFKQTRGNTHKGFAGESEPVKAAIACLKRAFAAMS